MPQVDHKFITRQTILQDTKVGYLGTCNRSLSFCSLHSIKYAGVSSRSTDFNRLAGINSRWKFPSCSSAHNYLSETFDRRRGRVGRGVGHLDHVLSYGVREVVSSIPDRDNNSRMNFSSDQVTGTVFPHLIIPFLQNSEFI